MAPKIQGDLFSPLKMGNYTFWCSNILGEAGKQEILQQIFRKF